MVLDAALRPAHLTPNSETVPRARRASIAEAREQKAAVDDPAVVFEAAARFLEARSRSVHEVRRRLTGAGYRPDLVDGAIERMIELGILDDEAFARAWVESRDRARPRGERAIREELRLKGVARSSVDLILEERRAAAGDEAGAPDERGGGSADRMAAERLLARHARALERLPDPRRRRERAYAVLARNGFDPETCREVAARVSERSPDEVDSIDDQDPAVVED
jgi:regulatory protein